MLGGVCWHVQWCEASSAPWAAKLTRLLPHKGGRQGCEGRGGEAGREVYCASVGPDFLPSALSEEEARRLEERWTWAENDESFAAGWCCSLPPLPVGGGFLNITIIGGLGHYKQEQYRAKIV
jgi:hypothetical protein